jgi:hypothetical protein
MVVVDSPEVLTGRLVRGARGGSAAAHELYADRTPDLPATFWLFVYLHNARTTPVDVWFTLAPTGARPIDVRYSPQGLAARGSAANALPLGALVAERLGRPAPPTFGPVQAVAPGHAAVASWRLGPGQLLCLWWPIEVQAASAAPPAFRLSLWEGPGRSAPAGGPLPPGPSGVVRPTLQHAEGSVTMMAPVHGAWAYDLDNDAPVPGGGAGGSLCPPAVCLDGEVATAGGQPLTAGADPLPGEMEGGVDALDAPGHKPAVAIWHNGAILRTGNYGDYGTRLTFHLKAPPGRVLYAAAVPGYNHTTPWAGTTQEPSAPAATWQLPTLLPPPGEGFELVDGAPSATITTTVTPGAYAPWRIVLWSAPAGAPSVGQGP